MATTTTTAHTTTGSPVAASAGAVAAAIDDSDDNLPTMSYCGSSSSMLEKEHKQDDDNDYDAAVVARDYSCCSPLSSSGGAGKKQHQQSAAAAAGVAQQQQQPSPHKQRVNNLVSLLLGRCGMCTAFDGGPFNNCNNTADNYQFVELQGLQFIGLGAMADELSPIERVHDTLEQLTIKTERVVSIGYLLLDDEEEDNAFVYNGSKDAASIDIDKKKSPTGISTSTSNEGSGTAASSPDAVEQKEEAPVVTSKSSASGIGSASSKDAASGSAEKASKFLFNKADSGVGVASSPTAAAAHSSHRHRTATIPLDVWNKNMGRTDQQHNGGMSKEVKRIVELTMTKQYKQLQDEFTRQLATQKSHPKRGNNRYLSGITAHNLGVLAVLQRKPDEEAIAYFREAICLKEQAFGSGDKEVALSWDELGIQFFARGDFEGALASFREAHTARVVVGGGKDNGVGDDSSNAAEADNTQQVPPVEDQPASVAMVLNNMACCYYQMGDFHKALQTLEEANEIQQRAVSASAQADLDLLHVGIVKNNCGYLKLALKQYEEARSMLEEALLIQQSVLDDNHRAVRDTLSNIEFANAFHS